FGLGSFQEERATAARSQHCGRRDGDSFASGVARRHAFGARLHLYPEHRAPRSRKIGSIRKADSSLSATDFFQTREECRPRLFLARAKIAGLVKIASHSLSSTASWLRLHMRAIPGLEFRDGRNAIRSSRYSFSAPRFATSIASASRSR